MPPCDCILCRRHSCGARPPRLVSADKLQTRPPFARTSPSASPTSIPSSRCHPVTRRRRHHPSPCLANDCVTLLRHAFHGHDTKKSYMNANLKRCAVSKGGQVGRKGPDAHRNSTPDPPQWSCHPEGRPHSPTLCIHTRPHRVRNVTEVVRRLCNASKSLLKSSAPLCG